jgi:hypothetical protein
MVSAAATVLCSIERHSYGREVGIALEQIVARLPLGLTHWRHKHVAVDYQPRYRILSRVGLSRADRRVPEARKGFGPSQPPVIA